jgi:hypothetical protein
MSGGIAPRIRDLNTSWKWVVSSTTRPFYPQGKICWYSLYRRLGGPQSRSGRRGTYLLTCLLTPWRRIFEKLIVTQLVKKYPAFLWNPKVHYRVQKSPLLDPILSQLNSVRPIDPHLSKAHLNVILPHKPRSFQWSLTFGLPNQNPVNTSPSTMRATCPAHLILLDLITLTWKRWWREKFPAPTGTRTPDHPSHSPGLHHWGVRLFNTCDATS